MTASKMKQKHLTDAKSDIRKDIDVTINPDLSVCEFNFGDVAWVRTSSYSWWPVQVVDEKSIGPNRKPRKKAESEVLIRLYGTYNYLYIDPVKNNEEFENIRKQKNGSIREMLEKALEEELSCVKNHCKTKGNPPPSKDVEMGDRIERNEETSLTECVGASSIEDTERGQRCTEEVENARDFGSIIKNPKKYYMRKQQLRQRDRGGTLRDTKSEEDDKSGLNCSKDVDKNSGIDPESKKLKKNVNRKQLVTEKSRGGTHENLHQDEVEEQQEKENTGNEVMHYQHGKPKTKQQDVVKLKQDEVKERKVKGKATDGTSNRVEDKKRKLTENTPHEVVTKHVTVDVHRYVNHAQVGKTHDASARRLKVMQSLALIAPSGSPFRRNAHVKPASRKTVKVD